MQSAKKPARYALRDQDGAVALICFESAEAAQKFNETWLERLTEKMAKDRETKGYTYSDDAGRVFAVRPDGRTLEILDIEGRLEYREIHKEP